MALLSIVTIAATSSAFRAAGVIFAKASSSVAVTVGGSRARTHRWSYSGFAGPI